MSAEGWIPQEGDMQLRIWLANVAFDYVASVAAVHNVIHDWGRKKWFTIEFTPGPFDPSRALPRLPCEQLFLGP